MKYQYAEDLYPRHMVIIGGTPEAIASAFQGDNPDEVEVLDIQPIIHRRGLAALLDKLVNFEHWFNTRYAWMFTNGNKMPRL